MPTVEARGKTFEFPDGVTEQQIGQALDEYFAMQKPQQAQETELEAGTVQPVTPEDPGFLPIEEGQTVPVPDAPGGPKGVGDFTLGEQAIGAGETALATLTGGTTGMLTGAAGGFLGAIGDLAGILTPEEAQELQQRAAAIGTYEPKTEAGRAQVEAIGEVTESLPPVTGGVPAPQLRIGRSPKPGVVPEQVVRAERFAEKTGSPLFQSDVEPPKTFAGKSIRGLAEKVPFVGTGGQRAKQQEARQAAIAKFIDETDLVTDQDLYNSLIRSQDKKKQALSKQYDRIGEQMGTNTVAPTKTASVILDEIEKLQKPGKVQAPDVVQKLTTLFDELTEGDVDYKGMRENRTLIRETLKSDESKTISDRVIDRVYKAMTEDIHDSVEGVAGSEAVKKLKAADAQLAKQYNEAKKTKLKNVLSKGDVKPEEVTKMLLSNDRSDNVKLYKELDKQGRENARGILIGELGKAFNDTESPEKFLQKAKKLDTQMGAFFKGDRRESYRDLISYLNQTKQAAQSGVYTQSGQQLMTFFTLAPVADVAGTGGAATLTAAGVGGIGRLLESRKVRGALRKIKNTRPYTPEYNQALISLDNAVDELEDE